MMQERLYDVKRAGEILGGLHPNDVYHLIHTGRLAAKRHVVRGKNIRPRLYVLQSELERYMRELPDAVEPPVVVAERPTRSRRSGRLPAGLRHEEVTRYYV